MIDKFQIAKSGSGDLVAGKRITMTKNQIPNLVAGLNVQETQSIEIWCLEAGIYLLFGA